MMLSYRISLLFVAIVFLALVSASCDLLGSTDDGKDGSVGTAPLSPGDLSYLEFEYWGDWSATGSGSYNTDVYITDFGSDNSSSSEAVYFWINDSSDSVAIDPGTYTTETSLDAGSVSSAEIIVGWGSSSIEYAASEYSLADFEDLYSSFDIKRYDKLDSGTVTVSRSGGVYTFEWSFLSADGDTVSGSYSGAVDDTYDLSGMSVQSNSPSRASERSAGKSFDAAPRW